MRSYRSKRHEISVPKEERQYCKNDGTFVGKKHSGGPPWSSGKCKSCKANICLRCALPGPHQFCRNNSVQDAYKDKQKGRDYNLCPACGTVAELHDGCNTIRCLNCHTEFCFICGEAAKHKSDHWKAGKPCLRWNRPDAANAKFDRVGGPIEDVVYIPEDEDFHLQQLVVTTRARLREVAARVAMMAVAPDQGQDIDYRELLANFMIALQNLITNFGFLDFTDRNVMDMHEFGRRHLQIEAFLERPRSGRPILTWLGMRDVFREYLAIRHDGDHPMDGRPYIDQERIMRIGTEIGKF